MNAKMVWSKKFFKNVKNLKRSLFLLVMSFAYICILICSVQINANDALLLSPLSRKITLIKIVKGYEPYKSILGRH